VPGRFRPLVLCYHAVSERWPHALAIPAQTLERQVRFVLRRGFRPGRAEDVVSGQERLLHVTFDDAYRNVEAVLPALERLGVPVTVFAATGFADQGGPPLAVPELVADAEAYPDELATMDWDALRALAARGVEVSSHTVSHPHLTRLGDEELGRELSESRERLEAELDRPCRFLAYPYGENDERVEAAARDAGYEAAFGLPGDMGQVDRYALPRVGIWRADGLPRVALKTSFVRGVVRR
jgi:peptidoglycan/xylan/chitin deacetylase (PgdA/CDA1 family)